jgi:RNA polymerase sigma-70 factor (ECF subfamily)
MLAEDSEYAFQLIYDRHRNLIYKLAIRYLRSPIMAQEVVQDIFLKLWIERKQFNGEHPLEAWLRTVTKNHLINKLKRIANEWKALDQLKHTLSEEDNSFLEKLGIDKSREELLKNAIDSLSEQQKQVYLLAKQENQSYTEIAEKMSISTFTVKTHMARALKQIKLLLLKGVAPCILYILYK